MADVFKKSINEQGINSIDTDTLRDEDDSTPVVFYHDPVDRHNAFLKRLDDSIIYSISKIEEDIIHAFRPSTVDVIYELNINGEWFKNIDLKSVRKIIKQYVHRLGDDHLKLQLVINCVGDRSDNNLPIWGTLIDIYYNQEDWYVEQEDENYSVWMIQFESIVAIPSDRKFSRRTIDKIRNSVVDDVKLTFPYRDEN